MTSTALRSTIKKQLNSIENDTILRSIHAMLNEVLQDNSNSSVLTSQQKLELDKTLLDHKAGKLKYYTIEQAKKMIYKK